MANYFFDTSGLVKRYIAEQGSGWIKSLTDAQSGNSLYVARVTGAELIAGKGEAQQRRLMPLPQFLLSALILPRPIS